jgi:hypothetical protein
MAIRIFTSDGHLIDDFTSPLLPGEQSQLLVALKNKGYLSSIPSPSLGGNFAVMGDGSWTQFGKVTAFKNVIIASVDTKTTVSDPLCSEINRRGTAQFGCLEGTYPSGNVFWYHYG